MGRNPDVPVRGQPGRRRKHGMIALTAVSAVGWTAAIAIDAANLDDHLWWIATLVAVISSLAALQFQLILMLAGLLGDTNSKLDQARDAMTALYSRRPDPADATPPPWRALRSARVVELHPEPGATPRSSGA